MSNEISPKGTVYLIEDNLDLVENMQFVFEMLEWSVVVASDWNTALELVNKFATEKPQYIFLDGNLSPNSRDGSEGEKLAMLFREEIAKIKSPAKIVGFSGEKQTYVDIPLGKGAPQLIQTITEIFAGKYNTPPTAV